MLNEGIVYKGITYGEDLMMSVVKSFKDPIRNHGIRHFFWKYNIKFNDKKLKIVYGEEKVNSEFVIRIYKNDIKNKIIGNLIIAGSQIPLFERPLKVEGTPIAWFSDSFSDKINYLCVAMKNKKEIIIGFDIFNEIGHILSGHLDILWQSNSGDVNTLSRIPIVDAYENFFFDCICMARDISEIKMTYSPFWPNGKKFAVCLTHDIDVIKKNYQYGTHFLRQLIKGNFSGAIYHLKSLFFWNKYPNPYWGFEKIMALESDLKLRSTFFFLYGKKIQTRNKINAFLEKLRMYDLDDPKLIAVIKKLNQEGWEIGLHNRYSLNRDENLLRKGKSRIENIIGAKIHGIRQHYLDFEIPDTWWVQTKAGFKYDSSIGFRDKIGFRFGTCFPFYPFDKNIKRQINVLEIPLIIMDATITSKENCWEECKRLIDTVKKYGGVLTIDWHQRGFNEKEFPGWKKTYTEIIKYCIKENAWIEPMDSIYNWWESK
jgi:peptidoglycan/xylan/chitin deacetylase (PgdA/CDA1 family)